MAKKNDMSSIKNIGLGILDTLSEKKEEEKNNTINKHDSKKVLEQKSNIVKDTPIKEIRSKRSFMLSDTTIQRLNLLKLCMSDKDLSTIVEESVGLYFDKNKESIEALIEIYNQVK